MSDDYVNPNDWPLVKTLKRFADDCKYLSCEKGLYGIAMSRAAERIEELEAELRRLQRGLSLARGVIRGGESWSDHVDEMTSLHQPEEEA